MGRNMSRHIHPTAILSDQVQLAEDVSIGPFAILEGEVILGPGCQVGPRVHLIGKLVAGPGNTFHTGCVIGDAPQHLGYSGEPTKTVIGQGNVFRENVTVHRGMPSSASPGTGETRIGDNNFFMVNSHIAHDCRVGNNCILANGAVVGGHAEVGDRAFLSGNSAVHQFCRVGRLAMLSGTSAVSQDLPPFWIVQNVNIVHGVNVVGMRRAGCTKEEINAVRKAYRLINKSGETITDAANQIESEFGQLLAVQELLQFIRTTKRGICTGAIEKADD